MKTKDTIVTGMKKAEEPLFNILKEYESKPSRNYIEEKHVTRDRAAFLLDVNASIWHKNGGRIDTHTADKLVLSEPDDSETITYRIVEAHDY